jgi:heterodisulfide reductase subunit C
MANINMELKNIAAAISATNPTACMKCGKCSGRCPSFGEMDYAPHMFVYMVEHGRVDELLQSKSLWNCLSCMACIERCPRSVAPGGLVEAVRLMATSQQGGNHLKPEDIPAKLDDELPQQAVMSAFRKYSK